MLWRNRTTSISSNKFLLEQYRKYFTTILHLMLFIHVIKSETIIYLKFCNKYFCRFIDPVLFFELKLYDLMLTIVVKWVIDDKKKSFNSWNLFQKKEEDLFVQNSIFVRFHRIHSSRKLNEYFKWHYWICVVYFSPGSNKTQIFFFGPSPVFCQKNIDKNVVFFIYYKKCNFIYYNKSSTYVVSF